MTARRLLAPYAAWMLALTLLVYALPAQHIFIWTAIGLSSVAAILIGTWHSAPRRRAPWVLLAAAVLCLVAGDLSADVLVRLFHEPNPVPSIADVFYLSMYVLIAIGMVALYRLGVVERDTAGVLDALTLTAGVGLISLVYLIGPAVKNPELLPLEKVISVGYPLGDILILAAGASLIASVRATPAVWLLGVGGLGLLASDIAYGLIQLYGTWRVGTPVDLGWILFYACFGAAALDPSMRDLTEPKVLRRRTDDPMIRLVLVGLSCLIAPIVLFVEFTTGEVRDGPAIAVFSAVLSLLVLVRLAREVRIHRGAVDRERVLRQAGAALLLATDSASVSAVVTHAVGRLLPSGEPHRVLLSAGGADLGTRPTMRYTRSLDRALASRLDGFEVTLCCPLAAGGPRAPDGGDTQALFVAAAVTSLASLQDAAQVLATQAALAVERIELSAEIDRRNSEDYFRTLVLNTADVILILNDGDRIRYASPSAVPLFGTAELAGTALIDLVDEESAAEVRWRLTRIRGGEPDHASRDWRVRRPSGEPAQVEASCRDLRADPTVAGLVVTLRDVTESRRMQQELYRRATLDSLTGLPNREVFVTVAEGAVRRAAQAGGVAAVIVAELDDFKRVNNTMGHPAGDELLVLVGQRLTAAVQAVQSARVACAPDGKETSPPAHPGWAVARLGGDEFAACVEAANDADVERTVGAIMGCFAKPWQLSRGEVTIGASVGVATATEADADAQELLRQADLAVYVAKDTGKGRSLRYEAPLHAAVVDRLRLRTDLEQAVTEGAFQLEYQPIVSLTDGHTAGFEALVRWPHPTRGPLPPGEFIDLAEQSGLIVALGGWVLRQAIRAAADWHRLRPQSAPFVSVNVSVRQFRSPGFVDQVRAELAEAGLPAGNLTLEITESMLVRDGGVGEVLNTLRADGIKVAIDDFGTGFSSLSYLRELPVDLLKLDKSFVDTVTSSKEQHAIITAITQMARTLDLEVVAEGIETLEELDVLVAMGCRFGQGYLLSRPMSYGDATHWLRDDVISVPVGTARTSSREHAVR